MRSRGRSRVASGWNCAVSVPSPSSAAMPAPAAIRAPGRPCRWTRRSCRSSRRARNCASGSIAASRRAAAPRPSECRREAMRLIIAIPLLIILVVFALSNTVPVRLGFWPTGLALEVPLAVAVLIGMAIAFLLGALIVWVGELGQRRRARRAEHTARLLEEQVQELKARLAARSTPALTPPG